MDEAARFPSLQPVRTRSRSPRKAQDGNDRCDCHTASSSDTPSIELGACQMDGSSGLGSPGSSSSPRKSSPSPSLRRSRSQARDSRTPRLPRWPLLKERHFLVGFILYSTAMAATLLLAHRGGSLPQANPGLTGLLSAAPPSRTRHRRMLEVYPAKHLATTIHKSSLADSEQIEPPELSPLDYDRLKIGTRFGTIPKSKVDMEVSRALLQNAHETYACGGTPTLPLKLSDEVQVVLRHLRQLDMLPARQGDAWAELNCSTCAVVGSSDSLLGTGQGRKIDAHACVFRVGSAPTVRYEDDVGSKTTVRFQDIPVSTHEVMAWHEGQDAHLLLAPRTVAHLRSLASAWEAARVLGRLGSVAAANASSSSRRAGGSGGEYSPPPGRPRMLLVNPAWLCGLREWTSCPEAQQPSPAFAAVVGAMSLCQEPVDLFGLDYEAMPYMYYGSTEDSERMRRQEFKLYPLAQERYIYSQLETMGAVNLHAYVKSKLFALHLTLTRL